MLRGILFKAERFDEKDDNNFLEATTDNTIILCNNYEIMDFLSKEILNTVNGQAEYNEYNCDEDDIGNAKIVLSFCLQRVIDINGQRITLALEPSIVYKANKIDDIWFFDYSGGAPGITYKESIYPMTIFKGSHEVWGLGLDEVYETVCSGKYGAYDGNWVNLSKKSIHGRIFGKSRGKIVPINLVSERKRM